MSDDAPESLPTFAAIRDQARPVGHLRGAIARERIPSAYLFLGPHHVGKRTTALALAKALNCEAPVGNTPDTLDACNGCPACRQIDAQWHPDVETVHPDGQFIKIDQVRAIADKLALNPFHARKRVIVVSQAERMNPQAANAFLKTLEEPPGNTLIVLCVENQARLPETIVSRCVPVRFGLLSEDTVREVLGRDWPLDEGALEFFVRFVQGRLRPDLAAKAGRWVEIREHMVQWLTSLDKPLFAQISEEVGRWNQTEDWAFILEWLEGWFRDVALLAEGAGSGHLLNRDRMDALRHCAGMMTPEQVQQHYRTVLTTRDGLAWNANKALTGEALWLNFAT